MRTLRELGEFGLIDRLERFLPTSPLVVEGIGDDCAVLRVGDRLLLASTDLFVEGTHFRRDWSTPEDIGWKAAAASLSDIAAMGGAPQFCLTSIACPADTPSALIEEIYQGISSAVSRFGAVIVGGDTTSAASGIMLDVIVLGEAPGKSYVPRHGAELGDAIVVTGRCGMSAAGLHALRHRHDAPELITAHQRPAPRISEGQWLSRRGVHAMIDISDGVLQDLGHIAAFSYLGIDINLAGIPIAEPLREYCEQHGLNAQQLYLNGGEDYELAFAAPAGEIDALLQAFHHEFRLETTVIGIVTDKWLGVRVDGVAADSSGFDHFKSDKERGA
ncbi:MAG: thiamine-phosphate kinase [Candidatus Hydrogenedentes bacterium]|nr:thiamine-phosphate kinase [Candidatus Hydrogenedentota bacterium]